MEVSHSIDELLLVADRYIFLVADLTIQEETLLLSLCSSQSQGEPPKPFHIKKTVKNIVIITK